MATMKTSSNLAWALAVIVSLCALTIPGTVHPEPQRKKIVFLTTADSHGKGEHEHQGGSKLLADRLEKFNPKLEALIINGWPDDLSVLKDADAIVINADGGDDHFLGAHLNKLDSILEKGTGIVMIHFALEIPKGNGGEHLIKWVGGYFETYWSVNPVWEASFKDLPPHPITRGVVPFKVTDEWYYHMRFRDKMTGVIPILQTLPPPSTLTREEGSHSNNKHVRKAVLSDKKPQVLAWAYERPSGGRGFGFTGGHRHVNWQDDNFRKIVLNAIAWTANIVIPDGGIVSSTPDIIELDSLTKKM
jgi:type 1 glutamine amidotransferase